jgi:hypothetical protein
MQHHLHTLLIAALAFFPLACDNGPKTVDSCGDGFVDPGEDCDGANLNGASCASLLFYDTEGRLACSTDCKFITTECGTARCGDGMIQDDEGEHCDGTELGGASCLSLGYERGELSCTEACRHDVSDCVRSGICGDGLVQIPEQCDGNALDDQTCESLGYHAGTLACGQNCQFDLGSCQGRCGDGTIDHVYQEECDGANLDLQSCETLGQHPGTLDCNGDCRFDLSGCGGSCGDGVLQTSQEECDGSALGGQTCETMGWHPGTLSCAADCGFDYTNCGGACGDGILQDIFEDCDGALLNSQSCVTLHHYPGTLACTGDCGFDYTNCGGACGDGVIQTAHGEVCDGANLDQETCVSQGLYPGTLSCGATCAFDLTGCGGRCGDGIIQTAHGEACEGSYVGSAVCLDVQKYFGTPSCDSACHLDGYTCRSISQWGAASGGSNARGVACDGPRDKVYVAGASYGALGGEPYVFNGDVMLVQHSRDGLRTWTRLIGTSTLDIVYAVTTDPMGNIVLTGVTGGALDGQTNVGGYDVFIIRYGADGVRHWTRLFGTSGLEAGNSVATDAAGNIYVAGYTQAALDGQPHLGSNDAFLVKYDSSGVRQWTRQWGTASDDTANGVALDDFGGVYVTGQTLGSLPGQTNAGGNDLFLVKFSAAGDLQWTRQRGSASGDVGAAIAVDSTGGIHIAGYVSASLDGQAAVGSRDLVLVKYNSTGVHQWTRVWGTTGSDEAYGVDVDGHDNILVTGMVFGPLDGQVHQGGQDIFLTRFSSAGVREWSHQWGTSGTNEDGRGVCVDAHDNAFVAGFTQGSLDGVSPGGTVNAFLIHDPNLP